MSHANAVVIPFPSQLTDTEEEDALLAGYLRAKRDAADAERRAEALKARAVAILKARGTGVAVPGLGALSLVETSAATIVDMDAVRALLEKHGEAMPVKLGKGGGTTLRASLLK